MRRVCSKERATSRELRTQIHVDRSDSAVVPDLQQLTTTAVHCQLGSPRNDVNPEELEYGTSNAEMNAVVGGIGFVLDIYFMSHR